MPPPAARPGRQADLDEAAEPADDYADLSEQAQRAELRSLVVAAIGGLNPGDREVIELNLRHDLDGADLAQALGVPVNQGHALASRARGQFERSLGALLVARTGREDCAELNRLLAAWDGELTPLLRKRVSRHIENCEVCGERKRRALSPAMLLTALPLVPLPAALRHQVLALVSDDSPAAVEYCVHVAARSRPFDASGFPVQLAPVAGVSGRRSGRSGRSGGPGGGGAAHARPAPGRSVLASVGVAAGLFLLGGGSVAWLLVTGAAHSLDVTSPHIGSVPSSAAAGVPSGTSAPAAPSPQPAGLPRGPAQTGPDSSVAGSAPPGAPPGSAPASAPVSPSSPPPSSRPPSSPPASSPPPSSAAAAAAGHPGRVPRRRGAGSGRRHGRRGQRRRRSGGTAASGHRRQRYRRQGHRRPPGRGPREHGRPPGGRRRHLERHVHPDRQRRAGVVLRPGARTLHRESRARHGPPRPAGHRHRLGDGRRSRPVPDPAHRPPRRPVRPGRVPPGQGPAVLAAPVPAAVLLAPAVERPPATERLAPADPARVTQPSDPAHG